MDEKTKLCLGIFQKRMSLLSRKMDFVSEKNHIWKANLFSPWKGYTWNAKVSQFCADVTKCKHEKCFTKSKNKTKLFETL
jgi:hypothetical protein